jgi:peptidoglycan hydrolase CwlO-like protein
LPETTEIDELMDLRESWVNSIDKTKSKNQIDQLTKKESELEVELKELKTEKEKLDSKSKEDAENYEKESKKLNQNIKVRI